MHGTKQIPLVSGDRVRLRGRGSQGLLTAIKTVGRDSRGKDLVWAYVKWDENIKAPKVVGYHELEKINE